MPEAKFKTPLLIANPVSGNGRALKRFVEGKRNLELLYPDLPVYITQSPDDYGGIRRMIQKVDPDLIIAFGGDGTLNDVVNGSEAEIPVMIVPSGSGNDFATLLGIDVHKPLSERLQDPSELVADLGTCNGRWFVNGLGIGFDGEIARQTMTNQNPVPFFLKYYLAIFKSIFFYKESSSEVSWDNIGHENNRYLMITIANGRRYGGSFMVAPLSEPGDGLLDLVLIRKVHPLLRLVYLPMVIAGKHLGLSFVEHHRAESVSVVSDQVLPAHTDGELLMARKFEVRIHPQKLRFIL